MSLLARREILPVPHNYTQLERGCDTRSVAKAASGIVRAPRCDLETSPLCTYYSQLPYAIARTSVCMCVCMKFVIRISLCCGPNGSAFRGECSTHRCALECNRATTKFCGHIKTSVCMCACSKKKLRFRLVFSRLLGSYI